MLLIISWAAHAVRLKSLKELPKAAVTPHPSEWAMKPPTFLSCQICLTYILVPSLIFFSPHTGKYIFKLQVKIHASFCNAEIQIGWVRRFALGLKSCRIPVKNQLQNKRNLTLFSNSTINQTHWIYFALPPFEDLTSWNLQPRLSSDSEGYNSLAVHHKIPLCCSAPNLIILYRVSSNFIRSLNACQ